MVIPLVAVVLSGVLGLAACSSDSASSPAPSAPPSTTTTVAAPVPQAPEPLPPPNALTDVLYRLADTSIPGTDKVGLVEYATADDAAALDRFGQALRDGGFTPLTFQATELAWSQSDPGNVVATITISTANEKSSEFVYPMEFNPIRGSTWQLTRQTADMLLQLGDTPSATPTR